MLPSNLKRFLFRLHPKTVIDVVNAVAVPYATIAVHHFDSFDSFVQRLAFDAVIRHLITRLVRDRLAVLQRPTADPRKKGP